MHTKTLKPYFNQITVDHTTYYDNCAKVCILHMTLLRLDTTIFTKAEHNCAKLKI